MYNVVMTSDEYGTEYFPRDTMEEACVTIQNLYARAMGDGVQRIIGLVVNQEGEDAPPFVEPGRPRPTRSRKPPRNGRFDD